jgi:sugar phosphate isomerase/epimerase
MQLGLYADIEQAHLLPNDQFDYIEENIQTLLVPEADEATFQGRLEIVRSLQKPVTAANRLLPPGLPPIGPAVDEPRLGRWMETTMRRAEQVGVKIIVWGSGVSRRVPEGFSYATAWEQFTKAVANAAPLAERHGVTIVIEPVARWDSNFIMSLADGARIVNSVGHPNVRLLADFYHMEIEGEPATQMVRYKDILEHVHLSEFGPDRGEPGRENHDLRVYLRALKEAGYQKGVVIESFWNNLQEESRSGLANLRQQMRDVGIQA